jgi:glutaredoxin 3
MIMNPYITVYTSTLCPVCGMVKQFLDTFDVSYKEVNVDLNPLLLLKLIGKTRKLSVPQTEVNGKWVSGFDPEKLLKVINAAKA